MAPRETHPHLHLFDPKKPWKYLVIGTFPPNTSLREKTYINYFYGNKGFLWKILHDLYNNEGYDFFGGSSDQNLAEIKRWQEDYCVGLSDTVSECTRRFPESSNDSDLVITKLNYALKDYVLSNYDSLEKIIFTSTFGKNSAFQNFRKIMGNDLSQVSGKLVTGLPSPSGAANITFFNSPEAATYGLTRDFFEYIRLLRPDLLTWFSERWNIKQQRIGAGDKSISVPSTPKGLVKEYKLWRYAQVFPTSRCR